MTQSLYLGIDLGTQSIKASVLSSVGDSGNLSVICNHSVDYDKALPQYKTKGGVQEKGDGVVTVPTNLWIEALERLLDELKSVHKLDFSKVAAISGSGQQHGSVYWKKGTKDNCFSNLSGKTLGTAFKDQFVQDSPIWMDSSTTKECQDLEHFVGGKAPLKRLTGSTAHERFTGPQIFKFYKHNDINQISSCERISLVSSLIATLFLGDYAPIDFADGSGMNLLDVNNLKWSQPCLSAITNTIEGAHQQDLVEKLGNDAVPSTKVLGVVNDYVCKQFGFSPQCKIVACSGDNPNSADFTLRQHGDLCISLGTSHTIFGYQSEMSQPVPLEGHYFLGTLYDPENQNSPNNKDKYLSLLCFKNGGLVRAELCRQHCDGDWSSFEKSLEKSYGRPRRNQFNLPDAIAFYYQFPEIVPHTAQHHGYFRFKLDSHGHYLAVDQLDSDLDVLSLVESQFLALKSHAIGVGLLDESDDERRRIIVTGGASGNQTLMQILADVFGCDVYIAPQNHNSAAIGAACRALYGADKKTDTSDYFDVVSCKLPSLEIIAKAGDRSKLYGRNVVNKYRELEQIVLKQM
ncbi:xylulokinase, partial [Acrasis kona]